MRTHNRMRYSWRMESTLISIHEVQDALAPLTVKQMDRLGELSGVPPTTIYKIKRGETTNPGIETVRKFMPYVSACVEDSAA